MCKAISNTSTSFWCQGYLKPHKLRLFARKLAGHVCMGKKKQQEWGCILGRITELAEKKVQFSAKNNGNTRRFLETFSSCANGHWRGIKETDSCRSKACRLLNALRKLILWAQTQLLNARRLQKCNLELSKAHRLTTTYPRPTHSVPHSH